MAVKGLGFEVFGAVPDKASLGGFRELYHRIGV